MCILFVKFSIMQIEYIKINARNYSIDLCIINASYSARADDHIDYLQKIVFQSCGKSKENLARKTVMAEMRNTRNCTQ